MLCCYVLLCIVKYCIVYMSLCLVLCHVRWCLLYFKCDTGHSLQHQLDFIVLCRVSNIPHVQIPLHLQTILKHPDVLYFSVRRQYPPFSLHELQRCIDVGRINPDEPIDLTTLCNTKLYTINPMDQHYGINLTDEVGLIIYLYYMTIPNSY